MYSSDWEDANTCKVCLKRIEEWLFTTCGHNFCRPCVERDANKHRNDQSNDGNDGNGDASNDGRTELSCPMCGMVERLPVSKVDVLRDQSKKPGNNMGNALFFGN